MTTAELITADRMVFAATVAELDARACERHARDIVHRLGGPTTFELYMTEVIHAALEFQGAAEERITELYGVTTRLFPQVPPEYDILSRLTTLVLKMMVERLTLLRELRAEGDSTGRQRQ